MPWLLRAQPYDEAAGQLVTLYFSDVGFTTEPDDTPASTYWKRRINNAFSVTRSIFAGAAASGRSQSTVGNSVLANADGALDHLAGFEWDGRLVEIRYTAKLAPVLADFEVVLSGTAARTVVGEGECTIQLRDLGILLDVPVQQAKFGGTGGADGPASFNDRRQPRVLGVARVFEPVLINAAYQIYAYGSGPGGGVLVARDRGLPFTAIGPDYPDYASLIAASGVGYSILTCDALSLIRFVAKPAGPPTLDALGPVRGSNLVAATFTAGAAQLAGTVAGRRYVLRAMIVLWTGSTTPTVNGTPIGPAVTETRRVVLTFTATSASTSIVFASAGFTGMITGASVVEWLARPADLFEYVVSADTTLTGADFDPGTIDDLNAKCPQVIGHWFDGENDMQVNDLLDQIVNAVGGYYLLGETRRIALGRFDGPALVADHVITERDIFGQPEPLEVEQRLKAETIGYRKYWRTHGDQDLADTVSDTDREDLRREYRTEASVAAGVGTASLLAREERRNTLLDEKADALAEVARDLAIHGPRHRGFGVTVRYRPEYRVADTVQLRYPRLGLAEGVNFSIMQIQRDDRPDRIRLEIWR